MSTLEKAILLLREMPDPQVEAVYAFMRSVQARSNGPENPAEPSAFGIAHKYADPSLAAKEKGAFARAMVQKHEAD